MSDSSNVHRPAFADEGAVCEPVREPLPNLAPAAPPSGDTGEDSDRDTSGRFRPGNRAAVTTGVRSVRFWQEHDAARAALRTAVLAQRGYTEADAPITLRLASDGLSQAAIVRDSAFARMVEVGGPLTSQERERGAYKVWSAAHDRVLKGTQAIGFGKAEKDATTLADWLGRGGDLERS